MRISDTTSMPMENPSNTHVPRLYLGGFESTPSSHVANIPPELLPTHDRAIATARRVCGAKLLAVQVKTVGGPRYDPGIERKSAP